MKPALLDVNLLLALAWPHHTNHDQAHAWFNDNARHGWATCPITQAGFVRISSNPKIIDGAVPPPVALELLRRICAQPHHAFWPAGLNLVSEQDFSRIRLGGHRQITDAYLLALARKRGGRLATLDQGLPTLAPPDWLHEGVLTVIA